MEFEGIPLYNKIILGPSTPKRSSESDEQTRVSETKKCVGKVRNGSNKKYRVRNSKKRAVKKRK